MSKNMPGGIPSNTLGVLGDIFKKTADGVYSHRELELFAQRKNPFETLRVAKGRKMPKTKSVVFPQTGIDWLRVYRELGMEAGFVAALPTLDQTVKENCWWMPLVKGVTSNKIVAWFRNRGVEVYTYADDLDKSVPTNDRDPNGGSYAVCFRQTVEADPEQKNKSAKMLAEEGVKGITLVERLLLELGFFLQTGDHLDKKNVTLCTGSRHSDGRVPRVDWDVDDRKLCVYWCGVDSRDDNLRARAAVS